MPQAQPIRLWSNSGRALCYRKLIRPVRTTQVRGKKKKKRKDMVCTLSRVDFPAVDDCMIELSMAVGGGFPLSAVRRVPRDASSVFRRDAEAFSGAPGSTGAAPACIDLLVLSL